MIRLHHAIPRADVLLGIVRAENIDPTAASPDLERRLGAVLERRAAPLTEPEDAVRKAARDILRNGRYKPTGRGKPASEYLLRTASRNGAGRAFPRINAPVDCCNAISLAYLLPISLWDLDRAGTDRFRFRLGFADEAYVFNTTGQTIALEDLVVGCRVTSDASEGEPIVNPVKDSMATKTSDRTRRVGACIYAPAAAVTREHLEEVCAEFAELLTTCGEGAEATFGIAAPDEDARV